MNQDEGLAAALREAAAGAHVGPAPIESVLGAGRTIRRRRRSVRAAVSVAVAVPALALVVVLAGAVYRSDPVLQPAPASTGPAVERGPLVWGAGQRHDIGGGQSLTLTAQGVVVTPTGGGAPLWAGQADGGSNGNVTMTVLGSPGRSLAVGLYRGHGPVGRVTVDLGGRTLEAQTATLPGQPGWCAFYVDASVLGNTPTVTVYRADGMVLARLDKNS
jgi:hypothetical protein